MSVYIVIFLQTLKKCLIVMCPKHSITPTIESNVIDLTYVGEQEIHAVLTCNCAICSMWPSPLFIVLYLALIAKAFTPLFYAILLFIEF